MKLALELAAEGRGYGTIHRAGCRDLRDPEPIGEAETYAQAFALALDLTGWDDDDFPVAPCAALRRG